MDLNSRPVLLACGPFGASLRAGAVGEALRRGLKAGGGPATDLLALDALTAAAPSERELLGEEHFDRRMLASRALVLAVGVLDPAMLAGSLTFELATRARQSGVPAYAVAAENRLGAFDERVLDLQVVLRAGEESGLRKAGRRLAALI